MFADIPEVALAGGGTAKVIYRVRKGYTAFAYVIEGEGNFEPDGDEVGSSTGAARVRFLLVSGKPIGEPIALWGPIVMNTQEELRVAFEEYDRGTFLKHGKK